MARCDDIYEAIRFNESQECYQDQQPASDWDAVSDDLMNKIQIKLLTSPSSCLMLLTCPYIKHHLHFEHAKAFMPSHIPFSVVFASHQRSVPLFFPIFTKYQNFNIIFGYEKCNHLLMRRHGDNSWMTCYFLLRVATVLTSSTMRIALTVLVTSKPMFITLYRSHQWSFAQIFNVYMENLSFHSILLPP